MSFDFLQPLDLFIGNSSEPDFFRRTTYSSCAHRHNISELDCLRESLARNNEQGYYVVCYGQTHVWNLQQALFVCCEKKSIPKHHWLKTENVSTILQTLTTKSIDHLAASDSIKEYQFLSKLEARQATFYVTSCTHRQILPEMECLRGALARNNKEGYYVVCYGETHVQNLQELCPKTQYLGAGLLERSPCQE